MMNPQPDLPLIPRFLADNISTLRKSRGISQSQLASLAGLPRSTVTYMESGEGNPSLQNLVRVSGALQVSIEELLSRPRAECKLIRSADVPFQTRSQGAAKIHKLLPDPIPGMEIDRIELQKGARMGGIPHTRNSKEYLVCVDGQLQIQVAGQKFDLKAGDVLAFPGDQHHSYLNTGNQLCRCVSVVVIAPHGV